MIDVITFDLWNTLFDKKSYSEQRLQDFFNFLQERDEFQPFNEFRKIFDSKFHFSDVTFEDINFRHIYTEDRISRVLNQINVSISKPDIEILKLKFETMMLNDPPSLKIGVKKTLEDLTENFQIGLISNTGVTPGKIVNEVLAQYDILQFFEVTVFSDETGLFKPHPDMFEIPLKNLNCIPQNAVHIGDILETDIKGAQDYNMLTIWINDSNSPKSVEIQPDYEIEQLYDAVKIIRNLL
ncbi:MAG: HAD family hydrolase [Promethearchaeota archaeon]|jgi:putative hydrolase of the HAD superfamily